MSQNNKQDSGCNEEEQVWLTTSEQDKLDPVPRQLHEAADLLQTVSDKLEECSVEWQANISRMQWKIFDSNSLLQKSWKDTVLARKHFTDKALDDAFQTLLSYNKAFADQLKNFVGLLQGVTPPTSDEAESCGPCGQGRSSDSSFDETLRNTVHLSRVQNQCSLSPKHDKHFLHKCLSIVQNSFMGVIKAKIDFDTKFLGFESVLHETSNAPNFQSTCLCQIRSDIVGSVLEGQHSRHLATTKKKTKSIKKVKCKRLSRSARTLTGRRGKSQPPPIDQAKEPTISKLPIRSSQAYIEIPTSFYPRLITSYSIWARDTIFDTN